MFKEPQIHRPTLALRDEGSVTGWLVTMSGMALLVVCLCFVITFYRSYRETPLISFNNGDVYDERAAMNVDSQVFLRQFGGASSEGNTIQQKVNGVFSFHRVKRVHVFAHPNTS
jgi:hypothetical protein